MSTLTRHLRLALALIFVCISATGLQAQTVQGLLISETTNDPVVGTEVTLRDSLERVLQRINTNGEGEFVFQTGPGSFTLRFQRVGYAPMVTEAFTVSESTDTLNLIFKIRPADVADRTLPYELTPMVVEAAHTPRYLANFERRRAQGLGDFVTRNEFERWQPRTANDVMRRMQGFYVEPNPNYGRTMRDGSIDMREYRIAVTTLSHNRSGRYVECPPLVYLDGATVGNTRTFDVALVTIESIEAVEAYSLPAQIPPEFNRFGSGCGVIAIWTRSGDPDVSSWVEFGVRYGASVLGSGLEWGRVGIHLVTRFVGPLEFYSAYHKVINLPKADGSWSNSGWQAQLAARIWPKRSQIPWYVGTGMMLTKRYLHYRGYPADRPEIEVGYVVLTGAAVEIGPFRPFVELKLIDDFTFSTLETQVASGFGVRF